MTIEEPDIAHAFNMNKRVDKFNIGLKDLNAHTLNIIEIIEEEKDMIQLKNHKEMNQKIKQAQNNGRRP